MSVTSSDLLKVFTKSFREWTRAIDNCDAAMARGNAKVAIESLVTAVYSDGVVEYTLRLLASELGTKPETAAEQRGLEQIELLMKAARPRVTRERHRQETLVRELLSVAKIPPRWRPPPRSLHGLGIPPCCLV